MPVIIISNPIKTCTSASSLSSSHPFQTKLATPWNPHTMKPVTFAETEVDVD
jgi:hypothetical protein